MEGYRSQPPHGSDVDVLASLLDVHRLETVVAGRIDLASPWRLEGESTDHLVLLVQARGTSRVVSDSNGGSGTLETGDVLVQPHGANLPGGPRTYLHDGSHPASVTRRLTAGATTATPPPLRLAPSSAVTCSLVFCLMRMQRLSRGPLWNSLPHLMYVRRGRDDPNGLLRRAVDMIIEESAAPGPAGTRLLSRLAETLLILALREHVRESSTGPGLKSLLDEVIAPAVMLIHTSPGERWTVGALAARCGLSRSAFAARFAAAVGETPSAYLSGWRIATAGNLLSTTDMSVTRIAEEVGYSSESAFRLAFVTRAGVSPTQFRRGHRG